MAVIGTIRDRVLDSILAERNRQDAKWGEQNHSMEWWMLILGEEVGEFSQALLHRRFGGEHGSFQHIDAELTHVAAVAFAMLECLERNGMDCLPAQAREKGGEG